MRSVAVVAASLAAVFGVAVVMSQPSGQGGDWQQAAEGTVQCVQQPGGNVCQPQSPSPEVPPPSSLFNFASAQAVLPSAQSSSPGAPAASPQDSATPALTPGQSTAPAPAGPAASTPPPQPAGLQPDGVPAAEVGSLVLNSSGAALWNSWDRTSLAGTDCDTPGTVAASGAELALTTNGTFGNCAAVTSKAKYTYGIFEARIWVQASPNGLIANWPGFWLVGHNWPVDGEIDGFEGLHGYDSASFHYGTGNSDLTKRDTALTPGWNIVDIVWKPQEIAVYYSGQKFVEWDCAAITGQPMVILFDTTTGSYGYTTGQPSTLQVDYLRVWTAA